MEQEPSLDCGFSLLEMLFALVIMSISSLVLFQSTSAMLQLSGRAVSAGERTLNTGLDRQLLNNLADGLLPEWPGAADGEFTGSAHVFSGQSTGVTESGVARLVRFSVSLESNQNGEMELLYRSEISTKDIKPWVLMRGLPIKSHWLYMGVDHKFYKKWPPETPPSRGYFNDDLLLSASKLPEAIKLVDAEGSMLWIGAVQRAKTLPERLNLVNRP